MILWVMYVTVSRFLLHQTIASLGYVVGWQCSNSPGVGVFTCRFSGGEPDHCVPPSEGCNDSDVWQKLHMDPSSWKPKSVRSLEQTGETTKLINIGVGMNLGSESRTFLSGESEP